MYRRIKTQVNILIRQKGAQLCFLIMLSLIIGNYIVNLFDYRNIDQACVPNFLKLSVLDDENKFGWYFMTFMTFLVVLPGGLSIAKEKKTRIDIHIISSCGGRLHYYIAKIVAVMLVTFCCFAIPFLIELVLNLCAFPIEESESLLSVDIAYKQYCGEIQECFLFDWFYKNPVLYVLARIGISSVLLSLVALIPLACSCVYSKYYAYLMVPVYLLFELFARCTFSVF